LRAFFERLRDDAQHDDGVRVLLGRDDRVILLVGPRRRLLSLTSLMSATTSNASSRRNPALQPPSALILGERGDQGVAHRRITAGHADLGDALERVG
jgi:hypothetical protein